MLYKYYSVLFMIKITTFVRAENIPLIDLNKYELKRNITVTPYYQFTSFQNSSYFSSSLFSYGGITATSGPLTVGNTVTKQETLPENVGQNENIYSSIQQIMPHLSAGKTVRVIYNTDKNKSVPSINLLPPTHEENIYGMETTELPNQSTYPTSDDIVYDVYMPTIKPHSSEIFPPNFVVPVSEPLKDIQPPYFKPTLDVTATNSDSLASDPLTVSEELLPPK